MTDGQMESTWLHLTSTQQHLTCTWLQCSCTWRNLHLTALVHDFTCTCTRLHLTCTWLSDESDPWITIRKMYWKSWSYPHILQKDAYLSRFDQGLHLSNCQFSSQNPEFRTSPELFHHWLDCTYFALDCTCIYCIWLHPYLTALVFDGTWLHLHLTALH